jgi:hypothetical protein
LSRFYLTRLRFGLRRWICLDYSKPEHYRVVALQGSASSYDSRDLAESAARFLGGPEQGFEVYEEGKVPEGMVVKG